MEWHINRYKKEVVNIFVLNDKYALSLNKFQNEITIVHLQRVKNLKCNDRFKKANTLSEIETLVLDLYPMIEIFMKKIEELPMQETCKNNYNQELIEFKEYFKKLERKHNEMVYKQF